MYTLPSLSYSYDALEPFIDTKTMEIHHSKHHQGYIEKLNKALEKYPEWHKKSIEELLTSLDKLPEDIKTTIRNNAGGHYNHSLFWSMMTPGGKTPEGEILEKINNIFGNLEEFKKQFTEKAMSVFGSGWVWLVEENSELKIITTPNQDNPISTNPSLKIILGLDVWEHAYYLKHQNRRAEYIENFWKVANWK